MEDSVERPGLWDLRERSMIAWNFGLVATAMLSQSLLRIGVRARRGLPLRVTTRASLEAMPSEEFATAINAVGFVAGYPSTA
jgi:hypothetical protein